MSPSGWVLMVIVLGGVWGGFVYLLYQTVKRNQG
jgi:hypothetical protein